MKGKTLLFIAAAFALTLTATPLVAQVQQTFPSGQAGQEFAEKGPWKKLGLTYTQKTEIQRIHRNTRAEMDKVLTTEQKEELKAAMQERQTQRSQGEGRGKWKKDIFTSLNLTDAQKSQIQEIRELSRKQMEAVLTPAQRQQLQQMQQNWKSRRQQGNSN
jgi:Spy/CpxP family protein refolding chaperone